MRLLLAAIALAASLAGQQAWASTLRVAPTSVEIPHGQTASTVRIWNSDREPLRVQVRVFRSTTKGGEEVLSPTNDVVASPPITTLVPGSENLIRIVRVSKQPVSGGETYRLLVDQLPDPKKLKQGEVKILIRHAIPVRFD